MIDRETRKKLGLPLTKDIIYIYPRYGEYANEVVKVKSFEIGMAYTSGNYSLTLYLENGDVLDCNSGLLKSLQCGKRYKTESNDVNVWDLDRLSRRLGW